VNSILLLAIWANTALVFECMSSEISNPKLQAMTIGEDSNKISIAGR
jgi:hypothetical protein